MRHFFSIIVPVYNRPDEVEELLASLSTQEGSAKFEVIIVEDGSTKPCANVVQVYSGKLNIRYFTKPNTGRSDTRNYGMKEAQGSYFIFFDSDCIITPQYFLRLEENLNNSYSDCFGGPDAAHESFSAVQKAINYAMTAFLTTGGIRGGKQQLEKFKPRTFNMGFSRKVYETVGGFNDMFGEDIDLALRIQKAGFRIVLYRDVYVYHKRRVSLKKFFKQVYIFGTARINLALIHKGSLKAVHTFPALFLLGGIALIILSIVVSPLFLLPVVLYTILLFTDALIQTKSLKTTLLAVIASYIQIIGYGWGFIRSFFEKIILRKGLESSDTLKRVYK
ncbi:MAG: glycosyltransferase [Prevotellaceae bacterium]|jgi:GT2 family glycosyltransferase|nr:glycosyltransferase [Prevotellaceae bacterium]